MLHSANCHHPKNGIRMKVTGAPTFDQAAISDSIARTAENYDSVPYPSYPYPRLQPARLAAIARLFGLPTQPATTAWALEIGCAAGGHIIPLAAAAPHAYFVGIDVSPAQIGQGLARIERLGLTNIELRCRSVTDLGPEQESFDYIICHGVYSWTPDAVREAILQVCRERLAADGVAVVSYNVLPGWRMLQIVRDCAVLHAGAEKTLAGRAAQVRQLLDICKKHTRESTSYGKIWRNEAQKVRNLPDSYLAHELFEENNSPCTFLQFADAATRHGLAYLGEANIGSMIPEAVVPEAADVIRDLSGNEVLAAEQYIDMLSGRTFRHTLLVHEARALAIDRSLDPTRMAGLHIIAPPGFKCVESETPGEYAFDDGSGTITSTSDSAVQQSMERFIARLPSSSRLIDLAPPDRTDAEEQKKITAAFMKMLSLGMVQISTEPIDLPAKIPERPKAWFVAASDAASRAAMTASRRHEFFTLNPLATVLLPLLDGTRCRDDLVAELSALARDGQIVVRDGEQPLDEGRLGEAAAKLVDQFLQSLIRAGMLVD
jgi:methyltransferase-like protein/2-polyprenyl-3-methyl-5-hydroxy-6-metoxy-1,4-benzoquinol methylase